MGERSESGKPPICSDGQKVPENKQVDVGSPSNDHVWPLVSIKDIQRLDQHVRQLFFRSRNHNHRACSDLATYEPRIVKCGF